MPREPYTRPSRMPALVVIILMLISLNAAGIDSRTHMPSASAEGARAAPSPPCNLLNAFDAGNFPDPPVRNNSFYPLKPGMQFILQGYANAGGGTLDHQITTIVTDLTKVVNGVRTVVLWDRDVNGGVLIESELAFQATDTAGNTWVLGEYPELYKGGQFNGAPDVWFSGLSNGQGGTLVVTNQQPSATEFLQAYSPGIIGDCGHVSAVNQHVCNVHGCQDGVLVIDESSPPDPAIQQKYYAPGVGNFQIGAVNDPEGETLLLESATQLSPAACVDARNAALALEAHAYQVSPGLYGQTAHMESSGLCTPATPTPGTPTPGTPTPGTPTPGTPTPGTPTPGTPVAGTPTATVPPSTGPNAYLPLVMRALPPPAPLYDGCQSDPDPASAANTPVKIVKIDKVAEVATLQNVSDSAVSLEDWNLCSLTANSDHDQIFGVLLPGESRDFPNIGDAPVWSDAERNDAALYNAAGFLVAYWEDK